MNNHGAFLCFRELTFDERTNGRLLPSVHIALDALATRFAPPQQSRVEEENRRLRRELGEARKLLCHPQREKVAFDFVQDIPSNITYSRPRNGLGQASSCHHFSQGDESLTCILGMMTSQF